MEDRGVGIQGDTPMFQITGKNYFLGIGINKYQYFEQQLHNACNDVEAIRDLLIKKYSFEADSCKTLFNEYASRDNILDLLYEYLRKATSDDKVLIYYAGHGDLDKGSDSEEEESGYWLAANSRPGQYSSYVDNVNIRDRIKRSKAKHVLLISDSCFSGSLIVRKTQDTRNRAYETWEKTKSRWIFSSGKGVVGDGKGSHSPFAQTIIEQLQNNDLPMLNIVQLADDVTKKVGYNYEQQAECSPLFEAGHDGGQFLFYNKNVTPTYSILDSTFPASSRLASAPSIYVLNQELVNSLKVAISLQQPLLLTGELGTGKTRSAFAIAYQLSLESDNFLPTPLTFYTKRSSTVNNLLYTYDAQAHSQSLQNLDVAHFIELQALGQAIVLSNPGSTPPYKAIPTIHTLSSKGLAHSSVVLIDEIDKADGDFQDDLINVLDKLEFAVHEVGDTLYKKGVGQIVVILTSNSRKLLPQEFLRRCICYQMPFPEEAQLLQIVSQQVFGERQEVNEVSQKQNLHEYIRIFLSIRAIKTENSPATEALIKWIFFLREYIITGKSFSEINKEIRDSSLSILFNHPDDLRTILRTINEMFSK